MIKVHYRFLKALLFVFSLSIMFRTTAYSSEAEREELSDQQLLEVLLEEGNTGDPQIGVATYYASRFTGRKTTSGQRYHPDKLTAAHAELPLGTLVKIQNLRNGLTVSVIVNDRCRRRSFQLIDLSRAAAKEIGLWGKGAIKVRILPYKKQEPLDELFQAAN